MIDMDQWAEIRRLHRSEGLGIKTIARRLGVARNTVRAALSSDRPPRYERAPRGSIADAVEADIARELRKDAFTPASEIGRRIGWDRSESVLRAKVAQMRPLFAPQDPTDRTVYEAGDIVQCDLWFPNKAVPVAPRVLSVPPVLTMVSAWSGFMMALMIPSRATGDLLAGMWRLVSGTLGAVPAKLVWDHETGIGQKRLTDAAAGFAGTLGCKIVQVKVRSPEHKGVVERCHDFLEKSFEPGRSFASPADFNDQLAGWLVGANQRVMRRTGARPADLLAEDVAAMGSPPPVAPATGFAKRARLGRDYYVRVLGNDYSVDPAAIGRMVEVRAGLEDVTAVCDGREVARHDRSWAARGVVTDPGHREKAAELRAAHDKARAERAQRAASGPAHLVAVADLGGYDQMFGVPDLRPWPRPTLGVVE
jgi:transposase